jgi:hypothetical protein
MSLVSRWTLFTLRRDSLLTISIGNGCGCEFCWVCAASCHGQDGIWMVGNRAHRDTCWYTPARLPSRRADGPSSGDSESSLSDEDESPLESLLLHPRPNPVFWGQLVLPQDVERGIMSLMWASMADPDYQTTDSGQPWGRWRNGDLDLVKPYGPCRVNGEAAMDLEGHSWHSLVLSCQTEPSNQYFIIIPPRTSFSTTRSQRRICLSMPA